MAMQIRAALALYMRDTIEDEDAVLTEEDPLWQLIEIGKDGPVDGSINHDDYLYDRV